VNDRLETGAHEVTWNGTAADGSRAAAGVYRCVMTTSGGRTSRNLVLVD
jgi:flagellar hook assembly protein FlgD